MKDIHQIIGQAFVPSFMSEEDFEACYRTSEFWTETNFYDSYRKHIVAMQHVSNCAKIYILKNYKQVEDWSGLNVIVIHGPTGKATEYYNYMPEDRMNILGKDVMSKMFKHIDKKNQKKHNPVVTLTEVVLDPTDDDFSLTINGTEHWWIQDEAVIIIAEYIEKQLKKQTGC